MERRLQEHKQELEQQRQDTSLAKLKLKHTAKLKKEAAEVREGRGGEGEEEGRGAGVIDLVLPFQVELKVAMEKETHQRKAAFLRQLRELGVDMTRYILSLQVEFVPEKEVIVGPATRTVAKTTAAV